MGSGFLTSVALRGHWQNLNKVCISDLSFLILMTGLQLCKNIFVFRKYTLRYLGLKGHLQITLSSKNM